MALRDGNSGMPPGLTSPGGILNQIIEVSLAEVSVERDGCFTATQRQMGVP